MFDRATLEVLEQATAGSEEALEELLQRAEGPFLEILKIASTPLELVFPNRLAQQLVVGRSPETKEDWRRLCTLLDELPEDDRCFAAIDALLDAKWPDWCRSVERAWAERFLAGDDHGALRLFRAIDTPFLNFVSPEELAASRYLSRITHLRSKAADYAKESWSALAESAHLGVLTHLDLTGTPEAACLPLVISPRLEALCWLELPSCELRDDELRRIAEAPCAGSLRHLDLGSDADLNPNDLTQEAVQILTDSPLLNGLDYLDLADVAIGDEGASNLVESDEVTSLRVLRLGRFCGSAEGLRILAESPKLERLEAFELRADPFSRELLHVLEGGFPSLREISLGPVAVVQKELDAFGEAFPFLERFDAIAEPVPEERPNRQPQLALKKQPRHLGSIPSGKGGKKNKNKRKTRRK